MGWLSGVWWNLFRGAGMTKFLKFTVVIAAILGVAGCYYGGTLRFDGPGNFQDFASARYECARSSQSYSSSAYINGAYGNASGGVRASCSVMDACLASKGYYRNPNGRLNASAIPISCNP